MALPHRVVKVTLSGTMFGGGEIWSTGFYMGSETADAAPITAQGMADVSAAWETFFKNASSEISNKYTYNQLKMHVVNNDGKTLADSAQYHSPATAAVGGSASAALPPQVALVATLANSLPRGLATKGRMFLPGINSIVDATGHIGVSSTGSISTNLKTFFDAIYNDADLPGNPVLASVGRGPLHTDGAIRRISTVRVGNVFDTQRRRRNALTESYTTKTVAGG